MTDVIFANPANLILRFGNFNPPDYGGFGVANCDVIVLE